MQINIKDYNTTKHISCTSSGCIGSLLCDYYVLLKMIHFYLKGKDIYIFLLTSSITLVYDSAEIFYMTVFCTFYNILKYIFKYIFFNTYLKAFTTWFPQKELKVFNIPELLTPPYVIHIDFIFSSYSLTLSLLCFSHIIFVFPSDSITVQNVILSFSFSLCLAFLTKSKQPFTNPIVDIVYMLCKYNICVL